MDKYIKVSDLTDLLTTQKAQADADYADGKLSMTSHIAIIGTLELLKKAILT